MPVAVACTKSTSLDSNVGASGKVMSPGVRSPNGSQISDGLNRNRSDAETTVTSTSPSRSCFTLIAAVNPPKFPPSTRTFLRMPSTSAEHGPTASVVALQVPRNARKSRPRGTNCPVGTAWLRTWPALPSYRGAAGARRSTPEHSGSATMAVPTPVGDCVYDVGVDLAWGPKKMTGLAVLDEQGR